MYYSCCNLQNVEQDFASRSSPLEGSAPAVLAFGCGQRPRCDANVDRARQALAILEDRASLEVRPDDVERYTVVRIADEVVVDLLRSACGVTLADVAGEIEVADVEGVPVPYLSPAALLRTKRTIRPKDAVDRAFLERLLDQ